MFASVIRRMPFENNTRHLSGRLAQGLGSYTVILWIVSSTKLDARLDHDRDFATRRQRSVLELGSIG